MPAGCVQCCRGLHEAFLCSLGLVMIGPRCGGLTHSLGVANESPTLNSQHVSVHVSVPAGQLKRQTSTLVHFRPVPLGFQLAGVLCTVRAVFQFGGSLCPLKTSAHNFLNTGKAVQITLLTNYRLAVVNKPFQLLHCSGLSFRTDKNWVCSKNRYANIVKKNLTNNVCK